MAVTPNVVAFVCNRMAGPGRPSMNSWTFTPKALAARKCAPSWMNTSMEKVMTPQKIMPHTGSAAMWLKLGPFVRASVPYGSASEQTAGHGRGRPEPAGNLSYPRERLARALTRPSVDRFHLLDGGERLGLVGLDDRLDDARDVREPAPVS